MPKTCPECGEAIEELLDEEEELFIPTCVGCGEQFINQAIAEQMKRIKLKEFPEQLTKRLMNLREGEEIRFAGGTLVICSDPIYCDFDITDTAEGKEEDE